MAGAGGGLAYNHVVAERNDDADLIVAASSATATRLAQNAYAGMTADQVRFVGAIGADPGVIVVAKDSIYQNLGELMGAIKADPKSVTFAGGSAEERVPGFESIPTAKEQGYDVVAVNWRGMYVPKGVSDDTFNMWADRLQKVADSKEWAEAMVANGLAPFTKVGADFQGYVDTVVGEVRTLSKELGVLK